MLKKLLKIPHSWILWIPAICYTLAFTLNEIVVALNGGQMPVLYPGGCGNAETAAAFATDIFHVCMTPKSHLKFLADWLVSSSGVSSIGDLFYWAYLYIRWPAFIVWLTLVVKDSILYNEYRD